MKHFIALSILILSLLIVQSNADLSECDDSPLPPITEFTGIGSKAESDEDSLDNLMDLLGKWNCQMKKGIKKFRENVKRNAEKLNENVKESVKKFTEKAKEVGSEMKTKFNDFKERLHKDSDEVVITDKKFFLDNVEIINPDILKTDQECGHGHILDSLGNCRKLRK